MIQRISAKPTLSIMLNKMTITMIAATLKNVKVFDDLYQKTKKMTNNQKGDLLEYITYFMFKWLPELNNNLSDIWLYDNIPAGILQELQWPDRDKGVDLLAKINGEYV